MQPRCCASLFVEVCLPPKSAWRAGASLQEGLLHFLQLIPTMAGPTREAVLQWGARVEFSWLQPPQWWRLVRGWLIMPDGCWRSWSRSVSLNCKSLWLKNASATRSYFYQRRASRWGQIAFLAGINQGKVVDVFSPREASWAQRARVIAAQRCLCLNIIHHSLQSSAVTVITFVKGGWR